MKSALRMFRNAFVLTALLVAGPCLHAFGQPMTRFYIGETEKNLGSRPNDELSRGMEDKDMVIFRIGQKTTPEVERALGVTIDGSKNGVGEVVIVSALVSGEEIKSLGLSVPIPVGSHGRSRSRLGFLPNDMFGKSGASLAGDQVARSSWDAETLNPEVRAWIASKGYGLVVPPSDPTAPYEALKRLVILEASNARKALGDVNEDMLVLFAAGSAQCDVACSAGTEVLAFTLGGAE